MVAKVTIQGADETAAAFASVNQNAAQTAAELKKAEAAGNNAGSSIGKFADMAAKVWALKETVAKLYQGLNQLAAEGNTGALALQKSFGDFYGTLTTLAEHPFITRSMTTFADVITNDVSPALESMGTAGLDAFERLQEAIANAITDLSDYVGATEGAREALDGVREAEAEAAEERAKRLESDKEALTIGKTIDEIERARLAARTAAWSKQFDTLESLKQKEFEVIKAAGELEKAGALTAEDRIEAEIKLRALSQRTFEVQRDNERKLADAIRKREEERKRAAEEKKKADDEAFRFEMEVMRREMQAARQQHLQEIQMLREKMEMQQAAVDQMKKALGGDEGAKQAAAGLDPRAVREQFARNQEEQARQQAGFGDLSKREQARRLKDARTTAFRNFNSGNVTQEAIAGAQSDLLQGAADQAAAQGRVSQETAQAVRQLAVGYQQEAKRAAETEAELRSLSQAVQQITAGRGTTSGRVKTTGRGQY